jgi:hypothetical protein
MSEQEKVDEVEVEHTDEAQEEKPKFSGKQQAELNRLLAAERKKEEKKYQDMLGKATNEWQATENSLRTTLFEIESGLQDVIKVQTSDFSPLVLKLLADKPVLEQWRLLQDPEFVAAARKEKIPPQTPNSQDKHTARPSNQAPFGGR